MHVSVADLNKFCKFHEILGNLLKLLSISSQALTAFFIKSLTSLNGVKLQMHV